MKRISTSTICLIVLASLTISSASISVCSGIEFTIDDSTFEFTDSQQPIVINVYPAQQCRRNDWVDAITKRGGRYCDDWGEWISPMLPSTDFANDQFTVGSENVGTAIQSCTASGIVPSAGGLLGNRYFDMTHLFVRNDSYPFNTSQVEAATLNLPLFQIGSRDVLVDGVFTALYGEYDDVFNQNHVSEFSASIRIARNNLRFRPFAGFGIEYRRSPPATRIYQGYWYNSHAVEGEASNTFFGATSASGYRSDWDARLELGYEFNLYDRLLHRTVIEFETDGNDIRDSKSTERIHLLGSPIVLPSCWRYRHVRR